MTYSVSKTIVPNVHTGGLLTECDNCRSEAEQLGAAAATAAKVSRLFIGISDLRGLGLH